MEEPPLLPLERPLEPVAPPPLVSESVAFVGPGRDLASLQCCVGLCDPASGVPPTACVDYIMAPRLLVAFRCPELYCPGPATPGGVRGFRGQSCVSVDQAANRLETHDYSPNQVIRHVVEVLSHESVVILPLSNILS